MINKLFSITKVAFLSALLAIVAISCSEKGDGPGADDLRAAIPATVEVVKGEPCTIYCENTLKPEDLIYFEKDGKIQISSVEEAAADHFSFSLKSNFEAGTYKISAKRGDRRVPLGELKIVFIPRRVTPPAGATIYGCVEDTQGKPIANVVVSDGVQTTLTNSEGIYSLKSDKKNGMVFISVPSGYECELNGVFPDHFHNTSFAADVPENHSFTLTKVDQSNYRLIFMGDMHVANRSVNSDLGQFQTVAADINKYVSSNAVRTYGITLGDMTWDLYWYDRSYGLPEYKKTVNECLSSTKMPIYHTIGNHDNDMMAIGNWNAKIKFNTTIAPPYYSFNIGDVHYIMLDNVDCSQYTGQDVEDRKQYEGRIYDPQWEWLANDLKYVNKSTPILVMMHVPVFDSDGVNSFKTRMEDADKLMNALAGYDEVHYVTGHTHRSYNVVPENTCTGGRNIWEHNLAAVCADWWWSGKLTPGLLQSTDGTPAGYGVWDVTGKNMKWHYKCAGKDDTFQFRAYDLDAFTFSLTKDVPLLTNETIKKKFSNIIAAYDGRNSGKHKVIINAWQMNARWTCTVKTEDGRNLEVNRIAAYDPIEIMACTAKRMNSADCKSEPIGTAQNRYHFFEVTAPDANTNLIITLTDEFGRSYTQTMERPKPLTEANYRINI